MAKHYPITYHGFNVRVVIDGEERWNAIRGVRYLEEKPNGEETIRIVSAREANPRERRIDPEQTTE